MRIITFVVLVAIAAACSKKESPQREQPIGSGSSVAAMPADAAVVDAAAPVDPDAGFLWYRVEAAVDKLGTIPFVIGIHRDKPEGVLYAVEERLPMTVMSRDPFELRIPVRGIGLSLRADGTSGRLKGQWIAAYYYKRNFDIVAEPIAAPRPDVLFPGGDKPAVDLSGTWKVDIDDFGVGRGHLRQDAAGVLVGTFIPPEIGDLRHLTGRVTGNQARLSAFDGMHGFYLEMTANDDGQRLTGSFLIAGIGKFAFTATREAPPDTHLKVKARMAPGKTKLASLPDLEKPPYLGNPVIVDYFGTWCPVCIDLTPELVRLQKLHAAAGLQVYSIALEPPGDEAEAQRRLDEFRAQFGMTWPFKVTFTDDLAGALPKELVDATGFPVTIFLRRDHTVAAIHTGFVSTAAPAERAAVIQKLEAHAAEIVAPAK